MNVFCPAPRPISTTALFKYSIPVAMVESTLVGGLLAASEVDISRDVVMMRACKCFCLRHPCQWAFKHVENRTRKSVGRVLSWYKFLVEMGLVEFILFANHRVETRVTMLSRLQIAATHSTGLAQMCFTEQ